MRPLIMIALGVVFNYHLLGDDGSSRFLSDSRLKALGEARLDNVKPDSPIVRITVLPSFEAPIMIKWLIQEAGKQSEAIVRRPKMEVNETGEAVYKGLDIDRRVTLSAGQTLALHQAMRHAKIQEAPPDDWKPPALDGSGWIVEYRDSENYRLLKRSNLPDDPDFLLLDDISKRRLFGEAKLSEFCMLLWNLTNVNDLLYFQKTNAQQGGSGQPASSPESESEGGDKPRPESKGRSR